LNLKRTIRRHAKRAGDKAVGALAIALMKVARLFDPDKMTDFAGWLTRSIGPFFSEHKVGRDNLVVAFPEKTPGEIDEILLGVWDNLGRVGAEFAHLDRLWDLKIDAPQSSRIEVDERTRQLFEKLRDDGKGALIFAAHTGNWELPALAGPAYGLESAVLYRRPNIEAIDHAIRDLRALNMGMLVANTLDAPLKLANALARGSHVGMLIDQHYGRGVEVNFFGRKALANPLLARLVNQVDVPIHGVRIIRLPNHRFRADLSEEVLPARNSDGSVDINGTMQRVTDVIEGWIREYPDQWLWLHRRWRS